MVKINTLELENIKRIRAIRMEPSQNGLTVIGGRNNQGKTSVLDAIAWVLGGNKFRPSQAERKGSLVPPHLKIQLSNGLVVERKGKNSDLKVTDPAGNRSGQQLLDEFIEDDAKEMVEIIEDVFKDMAGEFLISQKEAEKIADILKDTIDGGLLKDMYASDYRYSFAREIMQPVFEQVTFAAAGRNV